jgi:hypothetical protein
VHVDLEHGHGALSWRLYAIPLDPDSIVYHQNSGMKKKLVCFLCGFTVLLAGRHPLPAQGGGDQFLDGICP